MKDIIIAEYKASLDMLKDVIIKCPEELWLDNTYENAYWRIVYHTLYFTSLYLAKNQKVFVPWHKHRDNYHCLGAATFEGNPVIITEAFTKEDMLAYTQQVYKQVDVDVAILTEDQESGIDWHSITKAELHLYNMRHVQHHVGQLTERLHQHGIKGIEWLP